jgi:4-hydroxy-2-oxoheptanedioate aldolase
VQLGPATAPLMATSGFDWIALDAQHGLFDDAGVVAALRAMPDGAADVVVRVPANDPVWIGRALDAGADGVIVPLVDTVLDAQQAVAATHYPPVGRRSWGPFPPLFGRPAATAAQANDAVRCAVMIETAAGLEAVADIAGVPGVDMIFVGPFDLSLAIGQEVADTFDQGLDGPFGAILRACAAAGITAGAFAGAVERAPRLLELGFRVVAVATDAGLLSSAAAAGVAAARSAEGTRSAPA